MKAMLFAHVLAALKPALELGAFVIASVLLFRPLNRSVLASRMPFFLETVSFLLIFGLGDLGFALPSLRESLGGNWARRCYGAALVMVIVAGIPWAVVNLCRGQARLLNIFALLASACWAVLLFLGLIGTFVWYL